jgi:hypothetical protein
MRKTIFLLLALYVVSNSIPQTAFGWDTTAAKYYPLKVGNKYAFQRIQYFDGCRSFPLVKFKAEIIRDTLLSNGKKYFEFQSTGNLYNVKPYWKYQRIDSVTMNVFGYSIANSKDYLLDSLKANTSNSFSCARFQESGPGGTYTTIQSINFFGSPRVERNAICSPVSTSYSIIEGIGFAGYDHCLDFGEGIHLLGCMIDGVVYGDTATITSITQISSEVSDKFVMNQNYPNPFNPSTKINYELRTAGFVSLKVYNVMGKEMVNLVNEIQKAGSYEVTFDGANLPSGVYYYRIETNGFTEVKKMSLVK